MRHKQYLQDVDDAKIQDNILRGGVGVCISRQCCADHVHAQLGALLAHGVADLVRGPRTERHRPALTTTTDAETPPFCLSPLSAIC